MPWSSVRFPPAMSHLPKPVREKAVDIANALLEEGLEEGRCIRIAIAQAKRWAEAGSQRLARDTRAGRDTF